MVTGIVYGAADVEVNLAVEGRGIHSVFLADPRGCDGRLPSFRLILPDTLLTQTLLTPK